MKSVKFKDLRAIEEEKTDEIVSKEIEEEEKSRQENNTHSNLINITDQETFHLPEINQKPYQAHESWTEQSLKIDKDKGKFKPHDLYN